MNLDNDSLDNDSSDNDSTTLSTSLYDLNKIIGMKLSSNQISPDFRVELTMKVKDLVMFHR